MTALEVCCADIQSVRAAIAGGAQRIELCSALEVGGLTPSAGLIKEARILTCRKVKLHILIRPRPGDYIYTRDEIEVMLTDVDFARKLECDGVVIGALTPEGDVDTDVVGCLAAAAGNMSVTFHTAFDLCRDPFEAMEALKQIPSIDRILTSGLAPSAPQGLDMIKELVAKAPEGIAIMPGAGVNSGNAAHIAATAGVKDIHASAKTTVASEMKFRRGDVSMGAPGADEYSRLSTSEAEVKALVAALSDI